MKICEEDIRTVLRDAVDGEALSVFDKQRILRTAEGFSRHPVRRWRQKAVSLVAAAALTLLCATGVVAAVPGLAEKLGMLSRETLTYLRPIEKECESSGIRMEVVAAMNDGDSAVVYIDLRDVTGENRLDDTTDLQDYEMLDGGLFSMVDNVYARPDGSVVLRIVGQSGEADTLSGKKLTLSLDNILSRRIEVDHVDTGYTVADVAVANPTPVLNVATPALELEYNVMGDATSPLVRQLEGGTFRTLKPTGQSIRDARLQWASVLEAGVINGALHVLIAPDDGNWYNWVQMDLADETGTPLEVDNGTVYIGKQRSVGRHQQAEASQYQELLAAIPAEADPQQLHILYSMCTYDTAIDGRWDVTFTLEQPQQVISAECDMDMEPWRLRQVQLSPVGLTLCGTGDMLESSHTPSTEVLLRDGTVLEEYSSSSGTVTSDENGNDTILLKQLFAEPLDLDSVEAICVDGVRVWEG